MTRLLLSAFLSIPLIGAFVLFSLGIVVIYRASRVLNLAHGAMAMLPAYVFYSLTNRGLPTLLALPLAVAAGAALGVAVEYVFVRRLRPQGPTAQTVGTVAVTGLLIAIVGKVYGTSPVQAPGVFPQGTFRVGDVAIRYGELGLLATGLATAALLFTFFKRTEYGLAMRGSAQNRTAAILMGVDPDRAASAAWALGGGLAGLAGVLLAAVTNLNPYTLSLQVLPAFVAVLLGGLESLVGAVVGSVVAGLAFGLVPALNTAPLIGRVLRLSGAPQLVLTVLAVVVMVLRGGRFSGAEAAEAGFDTSARAGRRLAGPRAGVGSLTMIGVLVVWPFVVAYSVVGSSLLAVEFGLIAMSLVVLIGWVGQISLAQASFVGIGAAITAAVGRAGVGFPANAVAGVAIAAAVALALGAVALRVRGLYLAVATLIFAWMADAFLFPSPWLGLGGGSTTIPNQAIGKPGTIPSFDLTERTTLFLAFLAVVIPVVFALANVRDTRTGRAFFAIRGSEVAAASLGVDVVRYKLLAFGLSGALAGLAGALLVVEQRTVVSDQFLFTVSLQYLAIAVVGGLVSLQGALGAGVLFAGLNELFFRVEFLSGYLDVVSAALLAVVLLVYPGGLAAAGERIGVLLRPLTERLDGLGARLRRPPKPEPEPEKGDWLDAIRPAPVVVEAPPPLRIDEIAVERPPVDRATSPVLLSAENVTVRFGGLTAVSDASLTVHENEVVGLIGPNGAGKTTLFNAILGLNEPAAGSIALYGRDATRMQPHERARLGVARTFQVLQLFGELDVFDNLLVATHLHNRSGVVGNLAATERTLATETTSRERVREVLALLGLEDVAHAPVRGLPFGVLRMVELGRALVTGARLLMLDEAASGLNDAETDRLIAVVRGVRDLGVSTLLIEHDVRMVTGVSDYVYVLDQGRMLAEGPPSAIQRDPRVVAAYLGGAVEPDLVGA